MNRLALLIPLIAAAGGVAAQDVASITASEGTVLVNQGEQFVAVQSGQSVKAGDRVMASDGASANVRYPDGCDLRIAPGTLVTVPAVSPCAGGVPIVQNAAPAGTGAVGAGATAGGNVATAAWIAGGVLAGVAVYHLVEDDDDTSSP
ncbi:MAG TPA: hypothetical protein VIZ64_05220 [Dokdonella sp.]